MSAISLPGASTESTPRDSRRFSPARIVAALLLAVAPLCAPAQEATGSLVGVELRMERQLTPTTIERISAEDFAAAPGPAVSVAPGKAPLVPGDPSALRPTSTYLPAIALAALFLAIAAFAAGVIAARRARPLAGHTALQEIAEPLEAELGQAHATIEELRGQLVELSGRAAMSEVGRDDEYQDTSADRADAQDELERRQQHIRELEALLHDLRAERDALADGFGARDEQVEALERALAERDRELEHTVAELAAERARDIEPEPQERVAELEEQVASLSEQALRAEQLAAELEASSERNLQLEAQLAEAAARGARLAAAEAEAEALRASAAEGERLRTAAAELKAACASQRTELDQLASLAQAKDDKIVALESELASRCGEIETLQAERMAGAPPAGLEEEFAASQSYARELEDRVERLQAHIHQLEQILRKDEDVTTQLELGAPEQRPQQELACALERAEQRIIDLQRQLDAAREEIDVINRDPDVGDLQRENIRLSALIVKREHELAEVRGQQASGDLQPEFERLRKELAARTAEADALRASLAAKRNRVEPRDISDETIRMRLEPEKVEMADAPPARELKAAAADIDTLRFTIESRRDLAASLGSILEQERAALEVTVKRVAAREEMLVALEDEIAANRVTIAAMHDRLRRAQGATVRDDALSQKLEHELQRSVRAMAQLRNEVLTWRRRVKPLHEAVVLRDSRIRNLESEVGLLREVKLAVVAQRATAPDAASADEDPAERVECLEEIEKLRVEIDTQERALAEAGVKLSRALAAEETALQRYEELEAARAAQLLRIDELHHELATAGVQVRSGADGNVVDIRAHTPA